MSDVKAIADRFEIEALRGEFTDARDDARLGPLRVAFHTGRRVADAHIDKAFVSREDIRAAIERLQGLWDHVVQTPHSGTIQLEGDTAVGRSYIAEFGRLRDGRSHLNYSLYHDPYQRTPDGWKSAERVYEVRYLDTTPLAGSPPPAAEAVR